MNSATGRALCERGAGRFKQVSWTGGNSWMKKTTANYHRWMGLTAAFHDVNGTVPRLYVCNDYWTPVASGSTTAKNLSRRQPARLRHRARIPWASISRMWIAMDVDFFVLRYAQP